MSDSSSASGRRPNTGAGPGGVAVVTGGSRGIGEACVTRLAADGYRVVATGRDDATLQALAKHDERVETAVCDVTDEAAVEALFDRLPRIDVLVNNAGVSASAPLHRTTLEDWDRQLRVNATGAFLATRAALRMMRAEAAGRIVMVASTAGVIGERYIGAYTASKHAMVGLMRAVAAEVAGTAITCNAVCPDWVRTDMLDASVDRIVARTGRTPQQALEDIIGSTSLGRLLEPEEVADAVAYLCGPYAGGVNGHALVLDGGRTVT